MHRDVIEQNDSVPRPARAHDAIEHRAQNLVVERVEQKHHQVAPREAESARIAAADPHVATAHLQSARAREIVAGDRVQRRRQLDSGHLLERMLRREQHGASHPAADVYERGSPHQRLRHAAEQLGERFDRHGLVVRRVRVRVARRVLQLPQQHQCLGRNAVDPVEPPPGGAPCAGHLAALRSRAQPACCEQGRYRGDSEQGLPSTPAGSVAGTKGRR
jgi:hypothetical protein